MGNDLSSVPDSSVSTFLAKQKQQSSNPNNNNNNTFHLLVSNTYLIPTLLVNVKNTIACKAQSDRAAALGKLVANLKPDIVMLQEVWGAGMSSLETEMLSSPTTAKYKIEECCQSWYGVTLLDTVAQKLNKRGGLWFAHNESRVSKNEQFTSWYTFQNSLTKSNKGVVATKFSLQNQDSLIVFNTHLDPTNDDNVQIRQLAELAKFINEVLSNEEKNNNNSNQKLGAVVVGDFNFNSSAPQFQEMFKIFEKFEFQLEQILSDTKTSTYNGTKNPFVYWGKGKKDLGRLDWMFGISSTTKSSSKLKSVKVVREQILEEVFVSDHFPFEVELQIS